MGISAWGSKGAKEGVSGQERLGRASIWVGDCSGFFLSGGGCGCSAAAQGLADFGVDSDAAPLSAAHRAVVGRVGRVRDDVFAGLVVHQPGGAGVE